MIVETNNEATGSVATVDNYIDGKKARSTASDMSPVYDSMTGKKVAEVPLGGAGDVDAAVQSAMRAQADWADVPLKDRVQVFFKLKQMLDDKTDELAEICTLENGKTHPESIASLKRGVECVEFASSLPSVVAGSSMYVSRGVECRELLAPLGVVGGITPFNFPLMVPLWMWPAAVALGNAFVLKPSEQTPMSAMAIAALATEAGLPDGVLNVVQGGREAVESLVDHPDVQAIGFVGSTKVAKIVYERGTALGKRVRALGGAKNHLVVMPDAEPEMTASNVVASFSGCAGQRCMAASVLIAVGKVDPILEKIKEKAAAVRPCHEIGGIISKQAYERINGYIDRAESEGVKLILDGRNPDTVTDDKKDGYYIGPTIFDGVNPTMECACDEIFGPTLTVLRVDSLEEALRIENGNEYGNAAAIYTSSGGAAEYFVNKASAGMIGVNIGVPVPREPFPFGGWNNSAFGDGDLTGHSSVPFWTKKKKITTKWYSQGTANWMS
jgi:malonate-semialdehyde dehydrogenase (acetylating)/methylmalonate-semialdehyde dehydrogenase